MKTQLMYAATTVRKYRTGLLLSTLLITGVPSGLRSQTYAAATTPAPQTATVKHLGNDHSNMLFQVKVTNASGDKFFVTIRDQDGSILFQNAYSEKQFEKKFLLPKLDNERLIFTIKRAKSREEQTFEINTSSRVVEEIVVKRVG